VTQPDEYMNVLCRPVGLFHINVDNGHIPEIYFYRPSYLDQKSVAMLLHVIAGKITCADNHWRIYWGVSWG
jgi:hypothetical protein